MYSRLPISFLYLVLSVSFVEEMSGELTYFVLGSIGVFLGFAAFNPKFQKFHYVASLRDSDVVLCLNDLYAKK